MDFFDKLKIGERLEAMAGDASKSVKTALTPKAPFPLSISGVTDAASKKLDTTMTSATDTAEKKMRAKASTLQDNTVGKVTTAVDARVTSEVGRVEKKVNDKVASAEKSVDDTIDGVGKKVDGGIASANSSLDKALGRTPAADEKKDGKAAPLATGFTKADKKAAKKADKKAAKLQKKAAKKAGKKPEPAAETPLGFDKPGLEDDDVKAEVEEDTDTETPLGFDKPGVEDDPRPQADVDTDVETPLGFDKPEAKDDADIEPTVEPEGNFDEFNNSDSGVDVEGEAIAAARARRRAAQAEAEDKDDDLGLAGLFGESDEDEDDDGALGPGVEGPEDLSGEGEVGDVPAEDVLDAEGEKHTGETDAQDKARLEFKKKLRAIRNELHHLENGSTATGSGKDPWIAFFIASAKFKKKLALRDLKDELAGIKPDTPAVADKDKVEEAKTEDETPVAVDESGRESEDQTEVEIKSGMLRRGTKSKNAGDPVDTSAADPESADGRMIYAADKSNKLFIAYRPIKNNDFTKLLDRGKIVVAGEISVKDGKIDYMNNNDSGTQESEADFAALLQSLRDQGAVLDFNVDETESKAETTAEKIVEDAEEKAPEPEQAEQPDQADLLTVMKKNDAWKALIALHTEKLVVAVAKDQNWTVAGDAVVDATGQLVDIALAGTVIEKSGKKLLAEEAVKELAKRRAAKGAPATVDA